MQNGVSITGGDGMLKKAPPGSKQAARRHSSKAVEQKSGMPFTFFSYFTRFLIIYNIFSGGWRQYKESETRYS